MTYKELQETYEDFLAVEPEPQMYVLSSEDLEDPRLLEYLLQFISPDERGN